MQSCTPAKEEESNASTADGWLPCTKPFTTRRFICGLRICVEIGQSVSSEENDDWCGTPAEIRELIEEEVGKLGSRGGGLQLGIGIFPPTPPENIDALCRAIEEFRTYWWDGRGAGPNTCRGLKHTPWCIISGRREMTIPHIQENISC